MDIKSMDAVESTGTSRGLKTKNMKGLFEHFFFFPKKKTCAKRKKGYEKN